MIRFNKAFYRALGRRERIFYRLGAISIHRKILLCDFYSIRYYHLRSWHPAVILYRCIATLTRVFRFMLLNVGGTFRQETRIVRIPYHQTVDGDERSPINNKSK